MIRNFFIVALRNMVKDKVLKVLNVTGLAIGITVCLLLGVWLERENESPVSKTIIVDGDLPMTVTGVAKDAPAKSQHV